ncbi:MAG: LysM peptidoglycan-binding domain-containing protein [Planctomycetaceae bacterium]|nr:LysM peptidoglycan-binding domain-containing protein [Planctomycetaceae bacterium]
MSQESSNGPSRRPPKDGAPTSGAKDKDNDWGFANEEEEKTLEPRLGVVLVACLLLMFGFVLYNKYQQTKAGSSELVAEKPGETDPLAGNPSFEGQQSTESSDQSLVSSSPNPSATPSRMFDPFGGAKSPSSGPSLTEDTPVSNPASSSFNPFSGDQVASTSDSPQRSSLPSQAEPSPFNDDPFPESAGSAPQEDLLLADDSVPPPPQQEMVFDFEPSSDEQEQTSTSDDAQFDPFPESEEVAQSNPEPDPFGLAPSSDSLEADSELAEQQEPEPLESMDLAMPLAPQSNDLDPFAGGDINEEAPRQTNVEPNPFGDVAGLNGSSQTQQVDELAFPGDALPAPTQPDVEQTQPDPFIVREEPMRAPSLPALPAATPTQETVAQRDVGWDLEPVPTIREQEPTFQQSPPEPTLGALSELPASRPQTTPFTTSAPESVVGERELTVSKNDSLWSIAQEAYGTARYVPALAQYNQDRVPHPDKLKVGVKLRIPPPEVLETRFPNLFRTTNRRDTMIAPVGGQSPNSAAAAQSELFRDRQGRPVCRVGEDDTLSSLAQRYLGRSSRWTEIYGMNGDQLKSPETLKPGMILRLPADATRIAVDRKDPFGR